MTAAIERCRQTGVVAMTLANAHHIGRVGAYGEMASAAGLVSLHFVNVTDHRALVAPFRGTDARFSTNPVCIALPGTERQPPCCSTWPPARWPWARCGWRGTRASRSPEGILIDAKGKPTRDPNVMYSEPHGALLPFGGHKGYALAVVTELLAGALSGGPTIQPGNARLGGIINNMFSDADRSRAPGRRRLVPARDRRLRGLREGLAARRSRSARAGARASPSGSRARSGCATASTWTPTTWEEIVQAAGTFGIAPEVLA